MNKEEYQAFCDNAENMKVYDGRGKADLYKCEKCGTFIFTTYAVKGVTPFTMRCFRHEFCKGTMIHTKTYPLNQIEGKLAVKVFRWIRPVYDDYVKLPEGVRSHIDQGGLILETNELYT